MLISELLDRLKNTKKSQDGQSWTALCPGHNDTDNSLSIREGDEGKVLLKCHRGTCTFEHIIASLGLTDNDFRKKENKEVLTVQALAEAKGLQFSKLLSYGLTDIPGGGVIIPYYDEKKRETARRLRFSAKPGKGFRWAETGKKVTPYGLNQPNPPGKRLFLVEGESDCWTLWAYGYTALGLPGASTFKCLALEHVESYLEILVVEETDAAGEKFSQGVTKHLHETLGYKGIVKILHMHGAKDMNELFRTCPDFVVDVERLSQEAEVVEKQEKEKDGRYENDDRWTYDSSPRGIAEKFQTVHGEECIFDVDAQKWHIFDGTRWARDSRDNVPLKISNICQELYYAAPRTRKQVDRGAPALLKSAHRNDAEKTARLLPGMHANTADFDKAKHILCFQGGAIDLRTGETFKPTKADMISRAAGVAYDPTAAAPRWERALKEFFRMPAEKDQTEFVRYVQKAVGYCATGETKEQVLFILHGSNGSNGKSSFLGAIASVMGDYFQTMGGASLSTKSDNAIRDDIADYPGARIVSTSEPGQELQLNAEFVKIVTGEDRVRCRQLYGRYFEYIPNFKMLITCNHPPRAKSGGDSALWRRIRLIPFEHQFKPGGEDLRTALAEERPGILKWIIDGAKMWYEEGLGSCGKIETATDNIRQNMDAFHRFMTEKCVIGPGYETPLPWIVDEWCDWAEGDGDKKPMTNTRMGMMLSRKGYLIYRKRHEGDRMRVVRGFAVKSREEECKIKTEYDLLEQMRATVVEGVASPFDAD